MKGPYFCYVQSSGVGKAKILYEYKKASFARSHDPVLSFLIWPKCSVKTHTDKEKEVFDFPLNLDEGLKALHMLQSPKFGYEAFRFRCVQIWSREIRKQSRFAVFTGTDSDNELQRESYRVTSEKWQPPPTKYRKQGTWLCPTYCPTTSMSSPVESRHVPSLVVLDQLDGTDTLVVDYTDNSDGNVAHNIELGVYYH